MRNISRPRFWLFRFPLSYNNDYIRTIRIFKKLYTAHHTCCRVLHYIIRSCLGNDVYLRIIIHDDTLPVLSLHTYYYYYYECSHNGNVHCVYIKKKKPAILQMLMMIRGGGGGRENVYSFNRSVFFFFPIIVVTIITVYAYTYYFSCGMFRRYTTKNSDY